jgi:hypothetical protein
MYEGLDSHRINGQMRKFARVGQHKLRQRLKDKGRADAKRDPPPTGP